MEQLLKITLTQEQERQFLFNEVDVHFQRREGRIRRIRRLIVLWRSQNSEPYLVGKGTDAALADAADAFGGRTILKNMAQLAAKGIGCQGAVRSSIYQGWAPDSVQGLVMGVFHQQPEEGPSEVGRSQA